jgi:hypothetical protein
MMNIGYIEPFSRGWKHMTKALFHPFDLKKWFVVGFTAFLAELTDFHGGGNSRVGEHGGHFRWGEFLEFPQRAREWLLENPGWMTLILFGVFLLLLLILLLIWLSSRGKFMFLDNVIHDRAQVVAPWNEFRREGNSLFLFRLALAVVMIVVFGAYVISCFAALYRLYQVEGESIALLGPLLWMILGLVVMLIITAYIELFLSHFVVPIMYRSRVTVLAAWSTFLGLLSTHLLLFIGYGLFVLALVILVVIGIVLAGLVTCCIGFLILLIPYINSVILLPVSYTFRAFSVEFLEQFGEAYRLFPQAEGAQPS